MSTTLSNLLKNRSSPVPVVSPSLVNVSSRTVNIILGTADNSYLIDITSGTFTQTFTAATTLGNGWFCYIRNSGTGDITLDPYASELIDGLASYIMYPGEVRLITCTGTGFTSIVMKSFYKTFTESGIFTKPPGYTQFGGLLWGGGAGGTSSNGGAGGGGGSCRPFSLMESQISSSESVMIAAPASGGTGENGSAGNYGVVGNYSLFKGLYAYGGGTTTQPYNAGGGGGWKEAGWSGNGGGYEYYGVINTVTAGPGAQGNAEHAPWSGIGGIGGGGGVAYMNHGSAAGGASADFGGGGGGLLYGNSVTPGGSSNYGGGGGGAGARNGNIGIVGGTSIVGGTGGTGGYGASLTPSLNGLSGSAPGGGGGGAGVWWTSGSDYGCGNGGNGARGELRIWGSI